MLRPAPPSEQAGVDELRRTIREKEPPRPSTRLQTLQGEELSTAARRQSMAHGQFAESLLSLIYDELRRRAAQEPLPEVAESLGVSERTVGRDSVFARAWLMNEIERLKQ